MTARILLLSRARELEYRAGAGQFDGAEGDDADIERQKLLDHAWTLRAEFGQSAEVIESTQAYNFELGQRGKQQ